MGTSQKEVFSIHAILSKARILSPTFLRFDRDAASHLPCIPARDNTAQQAAALDSLVVQIFGGSNIWRFKSFAVEIFAAQINAAEINAA